MEIKIAFGFVNFLLINSRYLARGIGTKVIFQRMQLSISSTLKLFGAIVCLGLTAVVTLNMIALTELEVTGPVYNRIALG